MPALSAPAFVPLVVEAEDRAMRDDLLQDTGVIMIEICGAPWHMVPDCSLDRAPATAHADLGFTPKNTPDSQKRAFRGSR